MDINRRIAEWYLTKTEKRGCRDALMQAKITYGMQVFLSETEKFFVYLLIFCILGKGMEFLVSNIVVVSIRSCLGGRHMKTSAGCWLYSFCFFGIVILAQSYIRFSYYMGIGILFICALVILLYAPLASDNRPVYSAQSIRKFKIKGIFRLCIIAATAILTDTYIAAGIYWSIIGMVVDAISAQIIKERGENDVSCKRS